MNRTSGEPSHYELTHSPEFADYSEGASRDHAQTAPESSTCSSPDDEIARLRSVLESIAKPQFGIGFNGLRSLAKAGLANRPPPSIGLRGGHGSNERNARRKAARAPQPDIEAEAESAIGMEPEL